MTGLPQPWAESLPTPAAMPGTVKKDEGPLGRGRLTRAMLTGCSWRMRHRVGGNRRSLDACEVFEFEGLVGRERLEPIPTERPVFSYGVQTARLVELDQTEVDEALDRMAATIPRLP